MDAAAVSQGLCLDDSLSSLLRASTSAAHDVVQRGAIVNLLVTGQIPQELHIRYLMMLHMIYERLECALSTHRDDSDLSRCYNPALLARAGPLEDDIAHFTGTRDWRRMAEAQELRQRGHCPELDDYLDRIDELSGRRKRTDTARESVYSPPRARAGLLLAHAYVRYMGDLSGGQYIRAAVMSAYNLDRDGIRFYDFGTMEDGDEVASMSELKRIKHWFRSALDTAGQNMSHAEKANYVFELNVRLFSSFDSLVSRPVLLRTPDSIDSTPSTPLEATALFIEPTSRPFSPFFAAALVVGLLALACTLTVL